MTTQREFQSVRYERVGAIATVAINRPDARNSVTKAVALEIYDAVRMVAADATVRVLIFRGVGQDFCCGADLKSSENQLEQRKTRAPTFDIHSISILLHEMHAVTVAAIRGGCAGAGFGWACACDLRLADAGARFNTAFLDVGVAGDMGVPWLLPRLIGAARARDLSFLPRKLFAQQAFDIGLVTRVWPSENFESELDALVSRLAAAAPQAIAMLKSNYVEAERLDFKSFILLEAERHNRLLQTDDCSEAFAAWLQKRPGNFTGR
jgi:2-(1,2-epoxy-1,2-dihydrophenyl)acetyl-CoA isomerase